MSDNDRDTIEARKRLFEEFGPHGLREADAMQNAAGGDPLGAHEEVLHRLRTAEPDDVEPELNRDLERPTGGTEIHYSVKHFEAMKEMLQDVHGARFVEDEMEALLDMGNERDDALMQMFLDLEEVLDGAITPEGVQDASIDAEKLNLYRVLRENMESDLLEVREMAPPDHEFTDPLLRHAQALADETRKYVITGSHIKEPFVGTVSKSTRVGDSDITVIEGERSVLLVQSTNFTRRNTGQEVVVTSRDGGLSMSPKSNTRER